MTLVLGEYLLLKSHSFLLLIVSLWKQGTEMETLSPAVGTKER